MILDTAATDASFTDGRLPDQIDKFIESLRAHMQLGADRQWKLISARRKFGKELVEIEETGPSGTFRMIAKTGKPHRIKLNYEALVALWDAGLRPPEKLTVPKPIAYFPDRHLLVQEKAPGTDLMAKIMKGEGEPASRDAAHWLARVHSSGVEFEEWEQKPGLLSQMVEELATVVDASCAAEVSKMVVEAESVIKCAPRELVPAHGDFHPLNIFIADSGRITGIDVDKFGGRDRTEEVSYALAQLSCIGYHRLHSFDSTTRSARAFLDAYEEASDKQLDRSLVGAHIAITLIRNLHFDLYACKTGRTELVDPWLECAARCLHGDVELRD